MTDTLAGALWVFKDDTIRAMLIEARDYVAADPTDTPYREEADAIADALETELAKRGAVWRLNDGKITWG